MKTKLTVVSLFALLMTFGLIWGAAAQEPIKPGHRPHSSADHTFRSSSSNLPLPSGGISAQDITSAAVGQPSTVFRYVQSFGVVEAPYFSDTTHLNRPEGLFMDGNDNLYVIEEQGHRLLKYNSSGSNTLFLGIAGVGYTDDYVFNYPTDIALDGSGNIWVADVSRVVQYTPGGVISQSIPARDDDPWGEEDDSDPTDDNTRFSRVYGVAFDSAGRMFVSDADNHRIQVYTFVGGSSVYSTTIGEKDVAGSDNTHFDEPRRLAVDSSDRLYVVDQNNDRVQRCVFSGGWTCSAFDSGLNLPQGITIDSSDNVYIADTENGRIRKCPSAGTCSDFVTNTFWMYDLAVDSSGNVYGSTSWSAIVLKFNSSGTSEDIFLGSEEVPYLTDNSHYNHPRVAIDNSNNIIIVEENGQRLIKLNANGTPQWAVGVPGVDTDDNAHFNWPHGVAVDNSGKIYVADGCRVQIFNSNGTYSASLGGPNCGNGTYEFDWATGIVIDNNGNIYVSDGNNHRVQVFNSSRVYIATLGQNGVSGSDNSHFNIPLGLEVDEAGNIYVADGGNCRVQKFNSSRVYQMTLGTTSNCGDSFSQFGVAEDVAVDNQGRIYVADIWNNRVQVFDSTGAYLTTIGGEWGSNTSEFRSASSVDVDSAGNVYVTDFNNGRIQKFSPGVPGWTQININGFGTRWSEGVSALEPFNNQLYASASNWDEGVQIWRASSPWVAVSDAGFSNTYTNTNPAVGDMIEFNSQLYAGTGWSGNPGQIWRSSTGTSWIQVEGNGFGNSNNEMLTPFAVFDDQIYVGTNNGNDGVEIWRSSTGNSSSWSSVVTGGNSNPDNYIITGFIVFNSYLYAATENQDSGAEIWRTSDGVSWSQVNTSGFGDLNNTQTGGFTILNNYLYIGTRNSTTGGQIWRSANGTSWSQVMGNGFDDTNNVKIESLIVNGDKIYAVTANYETGAEVWHSADGSSWQQVNIDGWGDSNNEATLWANASIVFSDTLYIGTWNWANGGEIWTLGSQQVYLPIVLKNN